MKTIAFVIPWFGFDIPGGAEMELKGLVSHLHDAGVKVEILTTCVKELKRFILIRCTHTGAILQP